MYSIIIQFFFFFACVQFQAHAVADGSGNAEVPMDIIVHVIDQNDNKPIFIQDTFLGEVPEASPEGTVSEFYLSLKKMLVGVRHYISRLLEKEAGQSCQCLS